MLMEWLVGVDEILIAFFMMLLERRVDVLVERNRVPQWFGELTLM